MSPTSSWQSLSAVVFLSKYDVLLVSVANEVQWGWVGGGGVDVDRITHARLNRVKFSYKGLFGKKEKKNNAYV